jgi:hypothetical protein
MNQVLNGVLLGGPLGSGTRNDATNDVGVCVLAQSVTITTVATALTKTVYLPPNSQILYFLWDNVVAYDSSASATGTIGTSAGDSTYQGSIDCKSSAGRQTIGVSTAQALAMSNITTNTAVCFTVTNSGTPTVGTVVATVVYLQLSTLTN